MSYLNKVLQPDEKIRFVTKLHWIKYVPGFVLVVLAAVALTLQGTVTTGYTFLKIAALMLLAVALGLLFRAWFQRWTTEIAVTSKRIIYKRGFISRDTFEINLDKVESVDVDQSIVGRIFDYGNLTISGVGEGKTELPMIASPIEFRNHVTAE